MRKKRNYFYITVLFALLSLGFSPDTSWAEEDMGSFSANEPSSQGKSVGNSQKDEVIKSHPFMSLKDIQSGKPKPPLKELDASSDRTIETAKISKKQPGWFEKTFWLSLRGWIKESNRTDPKALRNTY